jgi:hypothetical protein
VGLEIDRQIREGSCSLQAQGWDCGHGIDRAADSYVDLVEVVRMAVLEQDWVIQRAVVGRHKLGSELLNMSLAKWSFSLKVQIPTILWLGIPGGLILLHTSNPVDALQLLELLSQFAHKRHL